MNGETIKENVEGCNYKRRHKRTKTPAYNRDS